MQSPPGRPHSPHTAFNKKTVLRQHSLTNILTPRSLTYGSCVQQQFRIQLRIPIKYLPGPSCRSHPGFVSLMGTYMPHEWVMLLLAMALSWTAFSGAELCDESCQMEQAEALATLYTKTGGPYWQIPEPWQAFANASFSNSTLPAHCSWYKVVCCTLDGQYSTSGRGTINETTVPCTSPGGVLSLSLQLSNMTGALPGPVFPSLTTLTSLDVSGSAQSFLLP